MSQEKFVPYPFYWDDAPIDLSFIFADERPAGKHGFLKCEGDRFIFEDGTEARFWGTNFNGGACFPTFAQSEAIAKRLAKFGCNIVRFHQLDAHWNHPNIFQFTKGKRLENTQTLDPDSMKALDYLIYCLKNEGIYVYMDLLTYRRFNDGDGMENTYNIIDGAKSISYFNRRAIQLQKKFNYDLFTHFNPYTGLEYKDDPVIVLTEITNEDDMFAREVKIEPYYTELLEKYKKWCVVNGKELPTEPVEFNARHSRQVTDFMIETQEDYFSEMIAHMREIGVKIPITGTNWNIGVHNRMSHLVTDFGDNHQYYVDWAWEEHRKGFKGTHMIEEYDPFMAALSFSRNFNYPFYVSEWDVPWPNHYRAESAPYLAAVSAFQGWSGCAIHTYRYSTHTNNIDILGKELSSSAIGGVPYREGMFSTFNDPAKFGLFYVAALICRRGDVRKANHTVEIELHDEDVQMSGHDKLPEIPALMGISEKHMLGMKLPNMHVRSADQVIDKTTVLVPESDGEVLSDTGELYRSWHKGYGWIKTPMTKVAYGMLQKNGTIDLDGVEITCETDFATIALSSLSDKPISESKNILLTAIGRSENTGMKFNEEGNVMTEMGTAPILIETISSTIKLNTPISNMKVWSINAEGMMTGRIPAEYADGVLTITTGTTWPSMYYLIQAD